MITRWLFDRSSHHVLVQRVELNTSVSEISLWSVKEYRAMRRLSPLQTDTNCTLLIEVQAPNEEIPFFFPTLSSALPQPWLLGSSQAASCLLDHTPLWGVVACRVCRTETISEGSVGIVNLKECTMGEAWSIAAASQPRREQSLLVIDTEKLLNVDVFG